MTLNVLSHCVRAEVFKAGSAELQNSLLRLLRQNHEKNVEKSQDSLKYDAFTITKESVSEKESDKRSNSEKNDPSSPVIQKTKGALLDIGSLAPRNAACALCDRHEYLHNDELPPFLTSPCYHCRESLAREAKISPNALFDMHLNHGIPWPGYLQVRFNVPESGQTLEELIAYDCKWRSRSPCHCLISNGGIIMPPCVEFPWMLDKKFLSNDSKHQNSQKPGEESGHVTYTGHERPNSMIQYTEEKSEVTHPVRTRSNASDVTKHYHLPCSSRHIRGAPMKCCHGHNFPSQNLNSFDESQDVNRIDTNAFTNLNVIPNSNGQILPTEIEKPLVTKSARTFA